MVPLIAFHGGLMPFSCALRGFTSLEFVCARCNPNNQTARLQAAKKKRNAKSLGLSKLGWGGGISTNGLKTVRSVRLVVSFHATGVVILSSFLLCSPS